MKLKHPESKQTIEVADEQADIYLTQGWEEQGRKSPGSDSADK